MKCVDCDHKYCEFCNAGDKYQKKAKANVVTNFDRIKAMSVEEMVEFLRDIQHEMFCSCQDDFLPGDDEYLIYPDNSPGWEKYLESEVAE